MNITYSYEPSLVCLYYLRLLQVPCITSLINLLKRNSNTFLQQRYVMSSGKIQSSGLNIREKKKKKKKKGGIRNKSRDGERINIVN